VDKKVDRDRGSHLDVGNFFLNFWTSISGREMIAFDVFLLLVGIEVGNIL
jgi:hypothetical protein